MVSPCVRTFRIPVHYYFEHNRCFCMSRTYYYNQSCRCGAFFSTRCISSPQGLCRNRKRPSQRSHFNIKINRDRRNVLDFNEKFFDLIHRLNDQKLEITICRSHSAFFPNHVVISFLRWNHRSRLCVTV